MVRGEQKEGRKERQGKMKVRREKEKQEDMRDGRRGRRERGTRSSVKVIRLNTIFGGLNEYLLTLLKYVLLSASSIQKLTQSVVCLSFQSRVCGLEWVPQNGEQEEGLGLVQE